MAWFRSRRVTAALEPTPVLEARVAALVAARADGGAFPNRGKLTRDEAMSLSVVNRSRDLIVGVLSRLPFQRWSDFGRPTGDYARVATGWLDRPDPTRTRAAFVADVSDDLFFYGWAACRVTSRDASGGAPNALEWLPWCRLTPPSTHRAGTPGVGDPDYWQLRNGKNEVERILDVNVIVFESPVTGVLESPGALWIAGRLDGAADRFAGTQLPAGWLQQTGGADLSTDELGALADSFEERRKANTIAALNQALEYHESSIDPSRLQLVEGRQFQDAALARVCNVPGFMVGAVIPGDSMTYRTAATARLDLIDFGIAPLIETWEGTLSGPEVTPRGQRVTMDPSPFLRTADLANIGDAAVPTSTLPTPGVPQ